MTVKQLIETLQEYPSDLLAVTEGYENGYNPIKRISKISVTETKNKKWWDGKYDQIENGIEVIFLDPESRKAE